MPKTYETIISVLDRFSGPIIGLEDKLSKLGHVGESTQRKLIMSPSAKLWHQLGSGVEEAKAKFGELSNGIGEMGSRMAEVLPMLGALGGAASVAGILEMVHATSEAAEALRSMSLITGVAVPQLQSLDFASQQSGVSMEILGKGLERLNINLGKAAEGQNKNAAALFKAMGINLRDANGHVKNLAQIMPQLETAFEKTTDPTLRAAMAMTLFGKSGEELLPFLTQGPAAIAEMQKKFEEFGYSFSGDDQKGLKNFQDSWNDAQLSVSGLRDEIGARLAPVMAPLLEDFARFVAQNRELVSTDLAKAIRGIAGELEKIDFKKDAEDLKVFATSVMHLIDHDHLGGLEGILAVAGAAMAVSFLEPLVALTVGVARAGFAVGAFALDSLAPLGATLIDVVPAIGSVADAMAALDLVMDVNPIGLLVVAVAALGAVGLETWEHWKWINGFFGRVATDVAKISFDDIFGKGAGVQVQKDWKWTEGFFKEITGDAEGFVQKLGKITGAEKLLSGAAGDMQNAWKWIEGLGSKLTALENDLSIGSSGPNAPYAGRYQHPTSKLLPPTGGSNNGHVSVNVNLKGAPPGTTVSTSSSGIAKNPVVKGMNGTIANHRRE